MRQSSDNSSFERYRLEVISMWPESEAKRAALKSARAVLQREQAFAETRDPARRSYDVEGSPRPY
jgi:hypothetical protein